MDRRGFLRMLGMGAAVAVASPKAYSFLGGILRPRPLTATEIMQRQKEVFDRMRWQMIERHVNPPIYMNRKTYEMLQRQTNDLIVVGPTELPPKHFEIVAATDDTFRELHFT